MKITDIEVFGLVCGLNRPFITGRSSIGNRNTIVTRIKTDAGITGECYGGNEEAHQFEAIHVIRNYMKKAFVGEDPFNYERISNRAFNQEIDLGDKGNYALRTTHRAIIMHSISLVDIALWDLLGKVTGVPTFRLLGGMRDNAPVVAAGGYYQESPDALVSEALTYRHLGYAGIKMMVGRLSPSDDAKRVRRIRKAVGKRFKIICDADQSWRPEKAIEFEKLVRELGIAWIEEPVRWHDRIESLKLFKESTEIPLAAGREESTSYECRELVESAGVDILTPDVTLIGGITEWRRIAHYASLRHVSMAHPAEPQISLHLLSSIPNATCVEVLANPKRDPLWDKLVLNKPKISKGFIDTPSSPGLGWNLNDELLHTYRIRV